MKFIECCFISLVALAFICTVALFFAWPAYPRDIDGRWAQSPFKMWFDSLKSKKGYCCSEADGVETEYDIRDNSYWAPIDGIMTRVPDDAVITEPNKIGHAIKWLMMENGEKKFRCFIPSSGM